MRGRALFAIGCAIAALVVFIVLDRMPHPVSPAIESEFEWSLSQSPALREAGAVHIDALFKGGVVTGHVSMNRYQASYSLGNDGAITIHPPAVTGGPPSEDVTTQAATQAYFRLLETVRRWSVSEGELRLYDAQGNIVFVFGATG